MSSIDEESVGLPRQRSGLSRFRWPLMIAGPLIILAIVAFFILTGGRFESTDDAYVQVGKAPISAAIAGRVIEVDVTENQPVRAGQVLFKLDPADENAAALRTDAALASARLQVTGLRAALDQQKLLLASALTTQAYAVKEAARQQALVAAGVSSRQQAADATHAADLATAQVAVNRQQVATALANLGAGAEQPDNYPGVLVAKAERETAQVNLARTVVYAPQDGIVTKVDQLQVGAYVNPAQNSLLSAVWRSLGRGELQGRPAQEDEGRTAGSGEDRRLWRQEPGWPRPELQPRRRVELFGPAGAERHGQLGEGRPAPGGQDRLRQAAAGCGQPGRPVGQGDGGRPVGVRPRSTAARLSAMAAGSDIANRGLITAALMLAK